MRHNLTRRVAGLIYAAPGPEPIHSAATETDVRGIFVNCWADDAKDAPQILADEYRWPRGRTGGEQWQIHGDVPHVAELERPVALPAGRHTVQVHLDHDILVAVVDEAVALSTRVYDLETGRVGVFASDGAFDLTRLDVAVR